MAALKYSSFTVPVMEKELSGCPGIFFIYGIGNGKGGTGALNRVWYLLPIRRAMDPDSLKPDPDLIRIQGFVDQKIK